MRFSCRYDVLLSNLQDIANVVEDALANEDDKNALFKFSRTAEGNTVKLIGISPVITFRRDLNPSDYQLTLEDADVDSNGVMFMQIKSKELLAYLNSYKSIRKTTVDEVIFEPERGKIKCTVIEIPRLSDDEIKAIEEEKLYNPATRDPRDERYVSHWMFDNVMIKPNKLPNINLAAPETELSTITSVAMMMYTSSLLPIMENSTALYGHMEFDKGHVVAFNKAFTTIMANIMDGNVFDGLKLSYRALTFVEKIICTAEEFGVAKTDRHIYFKTDSSEAFIVYDTKLAPYNTQLEMFTKDSYIRVDRIYLKDVLKRLSLANDSIVIDIKPAEGVINLSNSKFSQDINITGQEGMDGITSVKCKIMPDIFNKAIIGADENYVDDSNPDSADTFIYYCQHPNNNAIAFADITNAWFSIIRVKTY